MSYRPRFARGAPVMVPVPRERVERAPPERLALALLAPVAAIEISKPLPPVEIVASCPKALPTPVEAKASLPRASLNLVAIERPTAFSAVLPTAAPVLQAVSDVTGYPLAALRADEHTRPRSFYGSGLQARGRMRIGRRKRPRRVLGSGFKMWP